MAAQHNSYWSLGYDEFRDSDTTPFIGGNNLFGGDSNAASIGQAWLWGSESVP